MNEKQTLIQLEKLIQTASPEDVIAFVEKLVEKQPQLYAPLLKKLKKSASEQPVS